MKPKRPGSNADPTRRVPKPIGSDVELGNFIHGAGMHSTMSCFAASHALLSEVNGLPRRQHAAHTHYVSSGWDYSHGGSESYYGYESVGSGGSSEDDPQDRGRKWLATNSGCIYIDLSHCECATPIVRSASDFVAYWHAMLRIAHQAQHDANARLGEGRRIIALANNSDREGSSYGGHLNVLMSRVAWDDMFSYRVYPMLFFLMAYQASSIVFTGQGKVGSENRRPPVDYQISQRADFIETLVGEQTTYHRPLVNSRNEPLCGRASRHAPADHPSRRLARLHVIFYDTTLNQVATYLKAGVSQIILAMIEAGWMNRDLILEDPLDALHRWSHDPDLEARARTAAGQDLTAVELQLLFLEQARAFVDAGECEGFVPEAPAILELWEDTLLKLANRDFDALARRLDWVMKRTLIERALQRHPELDWTSPEVRRLDLMFSSIDPADGSYWMLEGSGLAETVVSPAAVERSVREPPEDTRAWTRAMLLRRAGPDDVLAVNWDSVQVRCGAGIWRARRTLDLADPLGFARQRAEPLFNAHDELEDLVEALTDLGRDGSEAAEAGIEA